MAALTLGSGAKRFVRNFNWPLAIAAIAATAIGIVCIGSAGLHNPRSPAKRGGRYFTSSLGVVLMIGVSLVDYRNWQRWAPGLYV